MYIGTSVPSSWRGAHGTGGGTHLACPSISQNFSLTAATGALTTVRLCVLGMATTACYEGV